MIMNKFNYSSHLFFKITFIILGIKNILLESCDYDTPLFKEDDCIKGPCSPDEYEENVCTLNNEIIKIQWLNDIEPVSNNDYLYLDIITLSKGALLIETSSYPEENKRIFYGIKKNGRPLFTESDTLKETSFKSVITSQGRQESFIFNIKLNGTEDDKEYVISVPKDHLKNIELYDYYNNEIYEQCARTTLKELSIFCFRGSAIKLNNINNDYILGISGINYSDNSKTYFTLFKLSFSSPDFINNDPIVKIEKTLCSNSRIVSCFDTTSQNIVCFYQNQEYYYAIAVYDYNLNNRNFFDLEIGTSSDNKFFKAIHFKGEIGAFGYFDNKHFVIHFKVYNEENNTISDYFSTIPLIIINKVGDLRTEIRLNDMIKISDSKICFVTYNDQKDENYVIIINIYNDKNIKIRYYNTKLFYVYNYRYPNELKINLYHDNLIAMAISMKNDYNDYTTSYLMIFSYPNSTDFDINVTEILKTSNGIYINPKEYSSIDNNLFGHIFYGIKIIDYNDDYELLKRNTNEQINKNSILLDDEQIELIMSEDKSYPREGRIEYAMVLTDPEYDDYNKYSFIIDDRYSDENEKNYFNKEMYIGRTSYINIFMDLTTMTKDCDNDENCDLCFTDSSKTCITCKYSIKIINGQKKCLPYQESTILKTSLIYPSEGTTSGLSSTVPKSELTSEQATEKSASDETFSTEITDSINEEKKCSNKQIIKNQCKQGKMNLNQLEDIKKELLNEDYKTNKTNILIFTENIIIQLSTLEDQQNTNNIDVSSIELGECEEKIKKANNISLNEQLIIYKTDIKSEDLSSTYVLYEIYDPHDLYKLELSPCKEVQISINTPAKFEEFIETVYDSANKSGYNILNQNDSFYQDNCAKYTTENGTDMLLSDRKNDVYSQIENTRCQKGCELKSYNSTTKKIRCVCEINQKEEEGESENSINNINNMFTTKFIEKNFYKTLDNSNFRVLKCYKLLFTTDTFKNIGEIIMSILLIIFLGTLIAFFFINKKKINLFTTSILDKIRLMNIKPNKHSGKNVNNLKKSTKSGIKKTSSKKINRPPKRNTNHKRSDHRNIDKNIINDNNTINETKKSCKNSGNYFQNNIFLNVNVVKSKKKTKKDHKYYLNRKPAKAQSIIYKKHFAKHKNNASSSLDCFNNKKENLVIHLLKNASKFEVLNDYELNILDYEKALRKDKRTLFQYYWSLLKRNQILLFAFLPSNDYNLTTVKIALFFISFSLYFCINGFFFSDSTMHKIYTDKGKYSFLYQLPKIIYSTLISAIINILLRTLALSEKDILDIKRIKNIHSAENKAKEVKSCLTIKFLFFYLISFLMFCFFWYFISCFCAVYINTQYILIKDTLISFSLSMITPFGLNLLPGMLRILALRAKNKDQKFIYLVSRLIALFI